MFLVEKGDFTFLPLFLRNRTLYLNLHKYLSFYPILNLIEVIRSGDQTKSNYYHISYLRRGGLIKKVNFQDLSIFFGGGGVRPFMNEILPPP